MKKYLQGARQQTSGLAEADRSGANVREGFVMRWRFVLMLGVTLALTNCIVVSGTRVQGSSQVVSAARKVSGFTGVELEGIGELRIQQTGTESLTIEAEDNILPLLTSDVSNGTLRLGTKRNVHLVVTEPIIYHLTVKDLSNLSVAGAGDASAPNLETDTLTVAISGSGNVATGGTADTQNVQISGSGTYTAEDLASRAAIITVSGSGDVVVRVSETLDATITGSGSIAYIGNPTVTQRISGSGTITQR
jgi:Putative auto-transporter adhesin, head GIN domain